MITYLIIQTVVLFVAAGFIIAGNTSSHDPIKARRKLFSAIGVTILVVFFIDVAAALMLFMNKY